MSRAHLDGLQMGLSRQGYISEISQGPRGPRVDLNVYVGVSYAYRHLQGRPPQLVAATSVWWGNKGEAARKNKAEEFPPDNTFLRNPVHPQHFVTCAAHYATKGTYMALTSSPSTKVNLKVHIAFPAADHDDVEVFYKYPGRRGNTGDHLRDRVKALIDNVRTTIESRGGTLEVINLELEPGDDYPPGQFWAKAIATGLLHRLPNLTGFDDDL